MPCHRVTFYSTLHIILQLTELFGRQAFRAITRPLTEVEGGPAAVLPECQAAAGATWLKESVCVLALGSPAAHSNQEMLPQALLLHGGPAFCFASCSIHGAPVSRALGLAARWPGRSSAAPSTNASACKGVNDRGIFGLRRGEPCTLTEAK